MGSINACLLEFEAKAVIETYKVLCDYKWSAINGIEFVLARKAFCNCVADIVAAIRVLIGECRC